LSKGLLVGARGLEPPTSAV